MAKRKTFDVETFKGTVNYLLATMQGDSEGDARYRKGMMTLLEDVLHETGNYRGFQYLGEKDVPMGCKPGINWGFVGDMEAQFFNTDQTRVVYF